MHAQWIVASSIFVWRIRLSTAPASSRSSVTTRRASDDAAMFAARSRLTAARALPHQWRCAACTIAASSVGVGSSSSPRSARCISAAPSGSLMHSPIDCGGVAERTAVALSAAEPSRHKEDPSASTTQPLVWPSVGFARRAAR